MMCQFGWFDKMVVSGHLDDSMNLGAWSLMERSLEQDVELGFY